MVAEPEPEPEPVTVSVPESRAQTRPNEEQGAGNREQHQGSPGSPLGGRKISHLASRISYLTSFSHANRYHIVMTPQRPAEPPFDPNWLDAVADYCRTFTAGMPRLVDLYLERRLEIRVTTLRSHLHAEDVRTEGSAVRWLYPSRTVLQARTGTTPAALEDLLSTSTRRVAVPRCRPIPPVEIDPPRQWRNWACSTLQRNRNGHSRVRFIARQAVIVQPGSWTPAHSPPLVRVEVDGYNPTALLAVWDHPLLATWLDDLFSDPPSRRWRPESGLQVPVLLAAGTAGVLIHETVGHLVEADLVISGESPLSAQAGATVSTSFLSVIDDPTRTDLPGAFSSDDEGVQATPRKLISEGRLVGWLCDQVGAQTLDCPAGRGRRASWNRPPVARLSNLTVAAGVSDPGSMERALDNALVVTRLGGATVDPASGRLLLRVERGWEIRHGRRRRPTEPYELTGNALDVLAHIEPEIGTDVVPDWRLGWCVKDGVPMPTGSAAPSIVVQRLEVL